MKSHRMRSSVRAHPRAEAPLPDLYLRQVLLGALFVAAVAVLSWPEARASSAAFGWMPLWLIGAPASAWFALQIRRLSGRGDADTGSVARRWRPANPPARRRIVPGGRAARRVRAA